MFPGYSDATWVPAEISRPAHRSARPDADEALRLMLAGNHRYAIGATTSPRGPRARAERVAHPYAVVVGCTDGRVPVEAVFDQPEGAVCVVRSAGHVVDRAVLGSVEFVVAELGVAMVMVLGHEDCLAVTRAVTAGRRLDGNLGYLWTQIAPSIVGTPRDGGALWPTIRRHVARTVATLAQAPQIAPAVRAGRVRVVGATYYLDSGRVEVL
jgi:carbonic anhydrase